MQSGDGSTDQRDDVGRLLGGLLGGETQDGPAGQDQLVLPAPVRLEGLRGGVVRPPVDLNQQLEIVELDVRIAKALPGRNRGVAGPSGDSGGPQQPRVRLALAQSMAAIAEGAEGNEESGA